MHLRLHALAWSPRAAELRLPQTLAVGIGACYAVATREPGPAPTPCAPGPARIMIARRPKASPKSPVWIADDQMVKKANGSLKQLGIAPILVADAPPIRESSGWVRLRLAGVLLLSFAGLRCGLY